MSAKWTQRDYEELAELAGTIIGETCEDAESYNARFVLNSFVHRCWLNAALTGYGNRNFKEEVFRKAVLDKVAHVHKMKVGRKTAGL